MTKKKKVSKKKEEKKIKYDEQEMLLLESLAGNPDYKISEQDIKDLKEGKNYDKIRWRADPILKKVKKLTVQAMKKQQQLMNSPMSRAELAKNFVPVSKYNSLAEVVNTLCDLLYKKEVVTQKEVGKRYQERVVEISHPDLCQSCSNMKHTKQRCSIDFTDKPKEEQPATAKEKYSQLTGAYAKRIIQCPQHQLKEENKKEK